MSEVTEEQNGFVVKAYRGDAKTLLAFNLPNRKAAANLAGFTIQVTPEGNPSYYLLNSLRYEKPAAHAQDASEPANSTINAPIHKFRWLHVPGMFHQGLAPFFGKYTYAVTPRFFDKGVMLPLDKDRSVSVEVEVRPFVKGSLSVGFTRGFTQSQAFVHHFGLHALIRPKGKELEFDTSAVSGKKRHSPVPKSNSSEISCRGWSFRTHEGALSVPANDRMLLLAVCFAGIYWRTARLMG